MRERVFGFIRTYHMLEPGERVIVGVSGGADSVCLLSVLRDIAAELSVSLRVIHVDHGIRGEEALRDAHYVEALCREWEIPCQIVSCDVPEFARVHELSLEEAGRVVRYEVMERAAAEWDAQSPCGTTKIAVAHHEEDNAETILHHLFRGSGLRGLSGMQAVSGRRIRPLLCVNRGEIEAYLRERGIVWQTDSTNAENDYTRNRIRNELLPLARETVNARATEHILQAGAIIGQADRYFVEQARQIWSVDQKKRAEQGQKSDDAVLSLACFCAQPEILQMYLLRLLLQKAEIKERDISAVHFQAVAAMAKKGQTGKRLDLPGGACAEIGYGILRMKKKSGQVQTDFGKNLQMRVFPLEKGAEIPKNQYTKWFDYDKIKGVLSVRNRQEGDYLILSGGGKKTLSRYMIDEKIPRERREGILLLADGSHIVWVIGHRISEYYKITSDTKTVLQVVFDGGETDGR